jgi:hypothetical protein
VCACGTDQRVLRFRPYRRVAGPPGAPRLGVPCAYHGGNPATTGCARCGSFLCDLCATPIRGTVHCTACFERLRDEGAAALRSRFGRPHAAAVALAAVSCLFFFTAPVFVPMALLRAARAWRERAEIAAREGRGVAAHVLAAGVLSAVAALETGLVAWSIASSS